MSDEKPERVATGVNDVGSYAVASYKGIEAKFSTRARSPWSPWWTRLPSRPSWARWPGLSTCTVRKRGSPTRVSSRLRPAEFTRAIATQTSAGTKAILWSWSCMEPRQLAATLGVSASPLWGAARRRGSHAHSVGRVDNDVAGRARCRVGCLRGFQHLQQLDHDDARHHLDQRSSRRQYQLDQLYLRAGRPGHSDDRPAGQFGSRRESPEHAGDRPSRQVRSPAAAGRGQSGDRGHQVSAEQSRQLATGGGQRCHRTICVHGHRPRRQPGDRLLSLGSSWVPAPPTLASQLLAVVEAVGPTVAVDADGHTLHGRDRQAGSGPTRFGTQIHADAGAATPDETHSG